MQLCHGHTITVPYSRPTQAPPLDDADGKPQFIRYITSTMVLARIWTGEVGIMRLKYRWIAPLEMDAPEPANPQR